MKNTLIGLVTHTVAFLMGAFLIFAMLVSAYHVSGTTINLPNSNAEAICFIYLK